MELFLTAALLLLAVYVVYLHMKLGRKELRIETLEARLSVIENNLREDKVQGEKILEQESFQFLTEEESRLKTFIHYTKEEADAVSILSEGFRFAESFYKTAIPVTGDRLDLIIKHNSRKFYGDYVIVIAISNLTIESLSNSLSEFNIKNTPVENVLAERSLFTTGSSELKYLLPKQFIKGFINSRTGGITKNPAFNPDFYDAFFLKNIEELRLSALQNF